MLSSHHLLITMFLAGLVVVISLPLTRCSKPVQTAEAHVNIINRHFAATLEWHQIQKPIQCSVSWAKENIPTSSDTILASCEDTNHQESLCNRESCHMGQSDQTPEEKPLSKYLFFTGCVSLKDEHLSQTPVKRYTVYPKTYEVFYDLKKLVASGYAAEIEGQLEDRYNCTWNDQLEQNFQRVWCNNCTDAI